MKIELFHVFKLPLISLDDICFPFKLLKCLTFPFHPFLWFSVSHGGGGEAGTQFFDSF